MALTSDVAQGVDPRVVWTDDGFGVTWADARAGSLEIYFAELDGEGSLRAPALRISESAEEASQPALAWTGDHYGLAWSEYISGPEWRVHFKPIARSGEGLGTELEWQGLLIGLVWTGVDFAVAFQSRLGSPSSLYLVRVGPAGVRSKQQLIKETWTGFARTSMAWNAGRFALASSEDDAISFRLANCF